MKSAETPGIVSGECQGPERLAILERRAAADQERLLVLQIRRGALFQVAFEAFEASLDDTQVREDQLVFHRAHVARRIDGAGGVGDRRVAEHPHDVE